MAIRPWLLNTLAVITSVLVVVGIVQDPRLALAGILWAAVVGAEVLRRWSRARPQVGWLVAVAAVGSNALFAAVLAGCLTAVIVALFQPPTMVWVILFMGLTAALTMLGLRRYSPEWYSWLLGRATDDPA